MLLSSQFQVQSSPTQLVAFVWGLLTYQIVDEKHVLNRKAFDWYRANRSKFPSTTFALQLPSNTFGFKIKTNRGGVTGRLSNTANTYVQIPPVGIVNEQVSGIENSSTNDIESTSQNTTLTDRGQNVEIGN